MVSHCSRCEFKLILEYRKNRALMFGLFAAFIAYGADCYDRRSFSESGISAFIGFVAAIVGYWLPLSAIEQREVTSNNKPQG